MKIHRCFAALVVLLMALGGCSLMLERNEYSSVSAHADSTPTPPSAAGIQEVSDYKGLKDAIMAFLRAGADEGTVRLRGYIGDAEKDVNEAWIDILRTEPIAVYALDYIVPSVTRLLSEYEVSFKLHYKRGSEQVHDIVYVESPTVFRERLADVLDAFGAGLTVETSYYRESQYDFGAMLSELYYGAPLRAMGMPELTFIVYPDNPDAGLRRVVEIGLRYPHAASVLNARAARCENAAKAMAAEIPNGLEPREKARWLYEALLGACEFDRALYEAMNQDEAVNPAESATAYGALCEGLAVSEGYALAYMALCREAGIDCRVARGSSVHTAAPGSPGTGEAPAITSTEHFWNLIGIGGYYYHVDLSPDAMDGSLTYRAFLLDDFGMLRDYSWDAASLPAADGPLSNGVDDLEEEGEDTSREADATI